MSRAELPGEQRVLRQRKEAGCRRYQIVADDDGAIVQRRARIEDCDEKIVGQSGIEPDTALDNILETDIALEDYQGADLV